MDTRLLRLAVNRITVLKSNEKVQLEEITDSEGFFLALTPQLLSQITGRRISPLNRSPSDLLRAAERDHAFLQRRGITAVSFFERGYPAPLREIFDPPYLLYIRGRLPRAAAGGRVALPSVAIVGTREPSAPASSAARNLGSALAAAGFPVISGLARGIDVAAHQGALQSGVTGAILACGADAVYPASHKSVAAGILERGGFLATEYAPGEPPQKYHFPARNRIISGLCRGVVVVQAPSKSGALITAEYALDQGRDLFVHRAGLEGAVGAGTADLAADGAMIIEHASEIAEEWGIEIAQPATTATAPRRTVTPSTDSAQAASVQVEAMKALLEQRTRRQM